MKHNRNMKQDSPSDQCKTEKDIEATIHYGFNPEEADGVHLEKIKACMPKKKVAKFGA